MFDRYVNQGRIDALHRFKVGGQPTMLDMGAVQPHVTPGPAGAPHIAPTAPHVEGPMAGGGLMDKVKGFGQGQWGAAKDLFSNLKGGLGGAGTPEAGAAFRQNAVGNLKTLAPSLLAGGALYMGHRHNEKKREEQARQHAMMMQGGGGY
jgi:hypothetical protein